MFIYCNLFRTSRTHSVWFLSLRDCYCNILLTYYLTYSMLLYLPLHYNEINLVDRGRIELPLKRCKRPVLPLSLTAHYKTKVRYSPRIGSTCYFPIAFRLSTFKTWCVRKDSNLQQYHTKRLAVFQGTRTLCPSCRRAVYHFSTHTLTWYLVLLRHSNIP